MKVLKELIWLEILIGLLNKSGSDMGSLIWGVGGRRRGDSLLGELWL